MIFGFEEDKFYIDFVSCTRPHGNMREESDRRALELAEGGGKFMLGFSGGVDSQSVLHSFTELGIPLETAFMYLPGSNDHEYEQVKILDKKYGIKTHVIDIDPYTIEKEIIEEANLLPAPWRYLALQKRFIKLLPKDYHIIQMIHDPFVYVSPTNKLYYYQGYYLPEISRITAMADLDRTGKYILYGDTTEFLLSIINDDVYRAALKSARYFDENGVSIPGKNLKTFDRWDYYIKPIIYGKYWGDELIYFPKYRGYENIEYLGVRTANVREHAIYVPYEEIIDFLKIPGGITKRIYENVPLE